MRRANLAAAFLRVVPDSAQLDLIADQVVLTEGPVGHPGEGCLYFSEIMTDVIWLAPGVGEGDP